MHEARVTRRDFLVAAAVGAIGCARRLAAPAPAMRRVLEGESYFYVGTYTDAGKSRGIYGLVLDRSSGAIRSEGLIAETASPSYLALAPDGRALYAVNELTTFAGSASGAVTALARNDTSGALSPLGQRVSHGGAPCYVTVDRSGRNVLVANYVGGSVAVLPISPGGSIGEANAVIQHRGRGAHPERQTGPHAHCIILDAANRFALAADLGIDRVLIYRFDERAGTLSPATMPEVVLRPGAGPRHIAFSPDGRVLYLVNELDSTIVAFAYDPDSGRLLERQTLSTRPSGAAGENFPADLHVHPAGHTVYASNRGDNTIAVFSVAPDTGGRLRLEDSVSTGGNWPRNFVVDPSGAHLLVANQRSDSVVGFRIDAMTGRLTPTGARLELPVPVCLVCAPRLTR